MSFTKVLNYILYRSGLPPDFRTVFVVLNKSSDLCTLQDLRDSIYYNTKFVALSTNFNLLHFTYVQDELIFILEDNLK